ncbi:MAG: 16S rRNA (cytosine(1402)-N(4))-methyltransferase RsmH [Acidaminococcaceae bacterium]|nr:16S rRNA (cytosine(1402)-N(4))-methyltransferase RsmH [Acidaminococcaceae bacterium]
MEFRHVSILRQECADFLVVNPEGTYVDCTLGGAGHSQAIADKLNAQGTLVGMDRDGDAVRTAEERLVGQFPCRIEVIRDNFKNLDGVLDGLNIVQVDGIFFDLGVSSYQLDNAERGFSYKQDGPLDMRMDRNGEFSAYQVVNSYSEDDLAEIIWNYGEERWARRIAQFIVRERKERPITTTFELVEIIKKAIPKGARKEGPHPGKRTFQAIRIEVNNELKILDNTMRTAVARLKPGGRIGVITFHSLEDRIVKKVFQELQKGCICPPRLPCVCGRKPSLRDVGNMTPSSEEITVNSRARSARFRFGIKV